MRSNIRPERTRSSESVHECRPPGLSDPGRRLLGAWIAPRCESAEGTAGLLRPSIQREPFCHQFGLGATNHQEAGLVRRTTDSGRSRGRRRGAGSVRPRGGYGGGMTSMTAGAGRVEVRVLGTFGFSVQDTPLPPLVGGSQRLLALLGLRDRPLMRASMASTLWPEATEDHAHSSLRSALGRLTRSTRARRGRDAARHPPGRRRRRRRSRRARPCAPAVEPRHGLGRRSRARSTVSALANDVLPDWYDDWVLAEAEEWRQLRLHALEALADRFLAEERFGEATGAALAAVRAEPLRESARAVADTGAPGRGQPVRGTQGVRPVPRVAQRGARSRPHPAAP